MCMRRFSGAPTLVFASGALARLLFPLGELILGALVGTIVLAIGIFAVVTAASIGLL
jgi:hypothetical protein